jgi:uncharacterized protein (DUF1330 family)
MPAYIAVDISINDPVTYDRYKTMAPPSIAKYGGRYLVRGRKHDDARRIMEATAIAAHRRTGV